MGSKAIGGVQVTVVVPGEMYVCRTNGFSLSLRGRFGG